MSFETSLKNFPLFPQSVFQNNSLPLLSFQMMITERHADRAAGFMLYGSDMIMDGRDHDHPPPLQPLHRGLPPPPLSLPMPHPPHHHLEDRYSGAASPRGRRQREFIPESKKDDGYWDRRRRNNEAAKRCVEKLSENVENVRKMSKNVK
jgi:hypothetical protein